MSSVIREQQGWPVSYAQTLLPTEVQEIAL